MASDEKTQSSRPARSLGDRLRDALEDFVGTLGSLLTPPQPQPIPVRVRYPQRRR
jgi:hypothetical protein